MFDIILAGLLAVSVVVSLFTLGFVVMYLYGIRSVFDIRKAIWLRVVLFIEYNYVFDGFVVSYHRWGFRTSRNLGLGFYQESEYSWTGRLIGGSVC